MIYHSVGVENLNRLNTDFAYGNSKHKKKRKVVVMKKKNFGSKRTLKKIVSNNGVIHLTNRGRKSENKDKADLMRQGQQEFLSVKTASNKSSFTGSRKAS
jgi:hypothetical protein